MVRVSCGAAPGFVAVDGVRVGAICSLYACAAVNKGHNYMILHYFILVSFGTNCGVEGPAGHGGRSVLLCRSAFAGLRSLLYSTATGLTVLQLYEVLFPTPTTLLDVQKGAERALRPASL